MFFNIKIITLILLGSFSVYLKADVKNDMHDVFGDDDPVAHELHEKEERQQLEQRLLLMKGAPRYSCDLRKFSSQCREYPISKDIAFKLNELKLSCESMPNGLFMEGICSSEMRTGRCLTIVSNYHDSKSIIYDNHYYQGVNSIWNKIEIKRVCEDMDGTYN